LHPSAMLDKCSGHGGPPQARATRYLSEARTVVLYREHTVLAPSDLDSHRAYWSSGPLGIAEHIDHHPHDIGVAVARFLNLCRRFPAIRIHAAMAHLGQPVCLVGDLRQAAARGGWKGRFSERRGGERQQACTGSCISCSVSRDSCAMPGASLTSAVTEIPLRDFEPRHLSPLLPSCCLSELCSKSK